MKNGAMVDMIIIIAVTATATLLLLMVLLLPGIFPESLEPTTNSKIVRLKKLVHSMADFPSNTVLRRTLRPTIMAEVQDDADEGENDDGGEDKKEDQKEEEGGPDRLWDAVKRG
jgi:flagellar basal body-associated protein FliL